MSETLVCKYKEGFKARDYAPINGMVIREFRHGNYLIQLIIYCPSKVRSESLFAWASYHYDESTDTVKFIDIDTVNFDSDTDYRNQTLPSLEDLGIAFYKKLTNGSLW